jgi:prepilin-type N-terminal cleavage/methylation domain-containing protein
MQRWDKQTTKGFTIVELLIVIVVIAILAAITIVSYNGIQTRAKVSVVQSDLRNIANQMEIFKVENGIYPTVSQIPKNDLATVLKKANLYTSTRAVQADWNNGIYPAKRFVFCSPNGDGQTYAVVAEAPLINIGSQNVGTVTYYIDQTGTIKSFPYTIMAGGEGVSMCVTATGVPEENWNVLWGIWSNSVPSSWAP